MTRATRRFYSKRQWSQQARSRGARCPRMEQLEQRIVLATVFDFSVDDGGFRPGEHANWAATTFDP